MQSLLEFEPPEIKVISLCVDRIWTWLVSLYPAQLRLYKLGKDKGGPSKGGFLNDRFVS